MLKYLVVGATRTQILESFIVFVEALPKLLFDVKNLLSYGSGPGRRKEFG